MEYIREEMYEKLRLTDEQIKACKKVFKSLREAGKLGVEFWDMYGTLTAYNGKKFRAILMDETANSIPVYSGHEGEELVYSERLDNFHAGCADDYVFLELK